MWWHGRNGTGKVGKSYSVTLVISNRPDEIKNMK
jgi:hypothetical protein